VYTYSGNTLTATDENGHATIITRHAFGNPDEVRVASVKDAKQNVWSYEYNAVGSLERVTAPGNIVRQWIHDSRNLLQTETHPESGTVVYEYYDNGTLKKKTDAKGTFFTYEYDGNDRLKKVTAGNDIIQITYEPGSDNRATMTAPDVLTTFLWDAAGHLKKRTDTIGGAVFDSWFTYDGNGNLETLTYPTGRRIQYVYTMENRLREIRNDNANQVYASTFDYHPSGAVKKFQSGNNVVTEIGYDRKRYWVNDIKVGSLRHFAYSLYDFVGNIMQIDETRAGVNMNQSFTYDNVDRLASASGSYGYNTFTYDAHGNRQDDMVYNQQNPFRLESFNGLSVTYDNNGNLTLGPGVQYDYVRGSVLERAVVNGTATHYRYDADDWRVKKDVTGGATTYFVRGPNGQLLTEWRNSSPNAEVRDFIYAGSRLIAVIKTTSLPSR
jgi:YD repeat-containing protein